MVDSHCHLADEAFTGDAADAVARAKSAGLTDVLCVIEASDPSELARAAAVCQQWDRIRLAVGVHPHCAAAYAAQPGGAACVVRDQLSRMPLSRAIGEIGLDYHYTFAPQEVQREVFVAQVMLAREMQLPIVIHTREADGDTMRILDEFGEGTLRGVFHCFSGDRDLALGAVSMGFHVSFSAIVTFRTADSVREAARAVPIERLLIETDSPYLAPAPHRGRRNEPARVVAVATALAQLRGVRLEALSEAVSLNYRTLFRP